MRHQENKALCALNHCQAPYFFLGSDSDRSGERPKTSKEDNKRGGRGAGQGPARHTDLACPNAQSASHRQRSGPARPDAAQGCTLRWALAAKNALQRPMRFATAFTAALQATRAAISIQPTTLAEDYLAWAIARDRSQPRDASAFPSSLHFGGHRCDAM